jgi:hypothetical protein
MHLECSHQEEEKEGDTGNGFALLELVEFGIAKKDRTCSGRDMATKVEVA